MSWEFLWRLLLKWFVSTKSWCLYSVTLILEESEMWSKTSRGATPSQSIGQRRPVVITNVAYVKKAEKSSFQFFFPILHSNFYLSIQQKVPGKITWTDEIISWRQIRLSTWKQCGHQIGNFYLLKYTKKANCLKHWNHQSWITRFYGCCTQTTCHQHSHSHKKNTTPTP